MKIGITVSFNLDTEEARSSLSHLRRLGYDCADLGSFMDTETEWFSLCAPVRFRKWEEIRLTAHDCGIEFSQTHGPWRFPPRDFTEEDRKERFEKICIALEGTAAVGAPCMAIHNIMPWSGGEVSDDRFMEINLEFFARLIEKARETGVVIALENMPFKNQVLSTPEQILNFVKEFDSPYLRVCLDTGHAAVFGISPAEAVRMIGRDRLACLHVHDNDGHGDLHLAPYNGVIDWADFSLALREIGFDGTFSLETNVSGKIPPSVRIEWEKALADTARAMVNG